MSFCNTLRIFARIIFLRHRRQVMLGMLLLAATAHAEPSVEVQRMTLQLASTSARYQATEHTDARALVEGMMTTAAGRRAALLDLMATDPAEALRVAIPSLIRDRMPAAVQSYVEEYRELTGRLSVRYEHRRERSRLVHELDTGTRRVELHFAASPPRVASGRRIRARGVLLGQTMALASDDESVTILGLDANVSAGSTTSSTPTLSNTFGEQRVLVLLVNWQDNPTNQPYSVAQAHELVFGTASNFLLENSFGRTWLTGEVHGWYTLPIATPTDNNTTCKQTVVAGAAQQAAASAGVDLSAFDRYIYVFPQTSCFPSGTGTVGGAPSETWINGYYFKLKTVAHELGHNLGLYHSGAVECGAMTLGESCTVFPYGDTMDVMGNTWPAHFNAYQKERLGWLDPVSNTIATVSGQGAYTLDAYETGTHDAPKALKIFKEMSPDTGDPTWYYVEHRSAFGFDDFLAGNDNVLNGVVVRTATETETPRPVSSLLLDMTPSSASDDWGDPALAYGETFTDQASGVTLTSRAGSGGMAFIDVTYGLASCSASAPSLVVSPGSGQWSAAGVPANYTLTITNRDSLDCDATTFMIDVTVPDGWTAHVDTTVFTITPGASVATDMTIVSSADASDGVYTSDINAARSGAASGTGTATYVVSAAAANHAPVAVDDNAQTAERTSVTINLLANDSDPDTDPLIVRSVTPARYGDVRINANGTVTYTSKRRSNGTDMFEYVVTDGQAESRAAVHVTLTSNGTANGKGKPK